MLTARAIAQNKAISVSASPQGPAARVVPSRPSAACNLAVPGPGGGLSAGVSSADGDWRDTHRESQERAFNEAGKCPTELAGLLGWFNRMLAAEAPAKLHKSGVEPDSVLGSPDRTEAFKRYIELDPMESDNAGYYFRPLAAAIATLGHTKPLAAMWLKEVGRAGDWRVVAARRKWSDEETEVYLRAILQMLWVQFKPDIRRR